jgi:hypothetical protein
MRWVRVASASATAMNVGFHLKRNYRIRRLRGRNLLKDSRPRRTGATAVLGVMLTGFLSLGVVAPAAAVDVGVKARPTGCHYQVPGNWGAVAQCSSHHGGSYRAWATCKYSDGRKQDVPGQWRQTGWSRAYCPGDSKATSAGIETSVTNQT